MTDLSELAHALVEAEQLRDRYDACRREAIAECTRQRDLKILYQRIAGKLAQSLRHKIIESCSRSDELEFPKGIPTVEEIISKVRERLEKEDGKNNPGS